MEKVGCGWIVKVCDEGKIKGGSVVSAAADCTSMELVGLAKDGNTAEPGSVTMKDGGVTLCTAVKVATVESCSKIVTPHTSISEVVTGGTTNVVVEVSSSVTVRPS